MTKLQTIMSNRQFQNIALCQLLTVISSNALLPVLPVYLKLQGFADSQIGAVMGIAAFGALAVRPLAGLSVDVKGSKAIILFGQALIGICAASYFFVVTFLPLLILRFFQGVAIAFYGTASVTFASCVETPEKTSGAIAFYSVFTMIGFGIATGIAPLFFSAVGFYPLIFLSLAVLIVAVGIIVFRAKPIIPCTTSGRVSYMTVVRSKEVLAPTICLFASNFAFSTLFTFIPLVAMKENIPYYLVFYIAFTVAVVSARLGVQKITDLWSAEKTAIIASIFNAASVLLIAVKASGVTFAVAGILIGLGFGVIYPTLAVYVVQKSNPANKGSALSVLSAAGDVGSALGASVLGVVADLFGYSALFLCSMSVVIVCAYYFYMTLVYKTNAVVDAE